MIRNSKNKVQVSPTQSAAINSISRALKALFHFSGSGQYFPMSIYARSLEDAQRVWNKSKVAY